MLMARWHIEEINSSSIRVWLEAHQIPAPAAYPGTSQPDLSTIAVWKKWISPKQRAAACTVAYRICRNTKLLPLL